MRLCKALQIPKIVRTENPRYKVTGCEALCILLRRLARGGGLREMGKEFQRSRTALAKIANHMLDVLLEKHDRLLTNLSSLTWLTEDQLRFFAHSVKKQDSPLHNCVGFIDGTIRPTCRPSEYQEAAYSGHKRLHGLNYQSIVFPNGLIGSLIGLYEGRRHNLGMLRDSGVVGQHCPILHGGEKKFCIFGDAGYTATSLLMAPFRGNRLSKAQKHFNNRMSKVRQSVEWGFGLVLGRFKFLDSKKCHKIFANNVVGMYKVAVLLTNCYICIYGNATSKKFVCNAPVLESYLKVD